MEFLVFCCAAALCNALFLCILFGQYNEKNSGKVDRFVT